MASSVSPDLSPHLGGFRIEPAHWYTERTLRLWGFEEATLARARKSGRLRCSDARRGSERLYLGAWVQAWLEGREDGANG